MTIITTTATTTTTTTNNNNNNNKQTTTTSTITSHHHHLILVQYNPPIVFHGCYDYPHHHHHLPKIMVHSAVAFWDFTGLSRIVLAVWLAKKNDIESVPTATQRHCTSNI